MILQVEENEQHVKILSQLTVGHSVYKNIKGELSHKTEHFHGLKNVQTVFPPGKLNLPIISLIPAHEQQFIILFE